MKPGQPGKVFMTSTNKVISVIMPAVILFCCNNQRENKVSDLVAYLNGLDIIRLC